MLDFRDHILVSPLSLDPEFAFTDPSRQVQRISKTSLVSGRNSRPVPTLRLVEPFPPPKSYLFPTISSCKRQPVKPPASTSRTTSLSSTKRTI